MHKKQGVARIIFEDSGNSGQATRLHRIFSGGKSTAILPSGGEFRILWGLLFPNS